MTIKETARILEDAQEVFFLAMIDGYAGGQNRKSTTSKTNNGFTTTVVFCDKENYPDYVVEDKWHTNPNSNKSFGSTLITFGGTPIWSMSYGGWYNPRAVSFLKMVLADNYDERIFSGGRGPIRRQDTAKLGRKSTTLVYENDWTGVFGGFRGEEWVYKVGKKSFDQNVTLGHHHFFGSSII